MRALLHASEQAADLFGRRACALGELKIMNIRKQPPMAMNASTIINAVTARRIFVLGKSSLSVDMSVLGS